MITEDYVSFEIAKLLKEKGFEGDVNAYYHIWDNGHRVCPVQEFTHSEAPHLYIPAPTLQMAMKWLREVHNLWCEISPEGKGLWYREVYSLTDEEYIPNSNGHKIKSYEEACEAAIKYSLENLIK